ncbi:DNA polymerase III subunit beta family protein [Streptomyces chartreusis]|uniref:DNA polymerase III subunit beta family protein n=1 Tax=Streptomyces chartreusis TaxID=1969 RepID=UPI0016779F40|nr:hypothetical protein [Streptomyces chartreusis]GGX55985.1 hypothetical protein GCM10010321_86550 [Streptomyces chartreusis]
MPTQPQPSSPAAPATKEEAAATEDGSTGPQPATAEETAPHARAQVAAGPLRRALKLASLAIRARPEEPVHRGVTLTAQGSKLTVAAYRPYAEGGTDVAVSVTVEAEPGGCGNSTLDHRELTNVLEAVVTGDSRAQAARTPVTFNGATVTTPDFAVPVRSYPTAPATAPPESSTVATVDGPEFFRQLGRVLPAAADDDTLPLLTGIEFHLTAGTLRLRASDRYRCAEAVLPALPWETGEDTTAYRAVIPGDVLRQMVKVTSPYEGPVSLALPADTVTTMDAIKDPSLCVAALGIGPATITAWRLDGSLPARWFDPVTDARTLTLPRQDLIRAVRKARAVAAAKGQGKPLAQVYLTHSTEEAGVVRVAPRVPQAQQQTTGAAVPATCGAEQPAPLGDAPLVATGAYLLDVLHAFGSNEITLHVPPRIEGRNHAPFVITAPGEDAEHGHRQILAPVRLSQG